MVTVTFPGFLDNFGLGYRWLPCGYRGYRHISRVFAPFRCRRHWFRSGYRVFPGFSAPFGLRTGLKNHITTTKNDQKRRSNHGNRPRNGLRLRCFCQRGYRRILGKFHYFRILSVSKIMILARLSCFSTVFWRISVFHGRDALPPPPPFNVGTCISCWFQHPPPPLSMSVHAGPAARPFQCRTNTVVMPLSMSKHPGCRNCMSYVPTLKGGIAGIFMVFSCISRH